MSSQIIPLKGRADSRDPAEFWPQRLFAFELRRGDTQLGPMLGSQQANTARQRRRRASSGKRPQGLHGAVSFRGGGCRTEPPRFRRPRSDPCDDRN